MSSRLLGVPAAPSVVQLGIKRYAQSPQVLAFDALFFAFVDALEWSRSGAEGGDFARDRYLASIDQAWAAMLACEGSIAECEGKRMQAFRSAYNTVHPGHAA